jgi:hypothetical protein
MQATGMESLFQAYKDDGLEILLVMISDENGNNSRQALLDFACDYAGDYGMTFSVAADPGFETMDEYLYEGTPLNMLLDDEMVIRYRVEALMPDTLEGNIKALLEES